MNVKLIQANLVKAYKYTTTNSFLVLVYCVILFSVLCQKTSVAKRPFMMRWVGIELLFKRSLE